MLTAARNFSNLQRKKVNKPQNAAVFKKRLPTWMVQRVFCRNSAERSGRGMFKCPDGHQSEALVYLGVSFKPGGLTAIEAALPS